MTGTDAYADLPVLSRFADVVDPSRYRALPASWWVGMTDVAGSTRAIGEGRYKAVNTSGASAISAVANALGHRRFPFVFGGDGASFAVNDVDAGPAREALAATAAWSREDLDLELRAAMIPVAAIEEAGLRVGAARFAASRNVTYAMFSGGGLAWAERAMKSGHHAIAEAKPGTRPNLEGLSCRWDAIPATRGVMLSLVVAPAARDDPAFRRLVEALLEEIDGSDEATRPVPDGAPGVSFPPPGLDLEARASRKAGESLSAARLRVWLATALAWVVMKTGVRVAGFDPARYRREVVENSDFRKFDDALRMTLDCTPGLADRLESRLRGARADGVAHFGLHRQDSAIMTCIVTSATDSDHVHFIDGAAGGYALAARSLKAGLA